MCSSDLSIIFQVAPAGTTGTSQNALATALTIDSTKKATFAGEITQSGQLSGVITGGTYLDIKTAGNDIFLTPNGTRVVNVYPGFMAVIGSAAIGFNTNATLAPDVTLYRDAANTLALRNSTNAQRFNSYRSYTDASNYSRLSLAWNTSTALVMAEGAGTGTDGSVAFNDAALATDATRGYVMIPSCAGTPTGTPADIPTGQIPMVWDSTNLKLYVYTGGAWKASAAFT